jgi:hypothetical protein
VIGGSKPHKRPASPRNWTKAKVDEFLAVLAETCNVSEAARQSGLCLSYAYKKRSADAQFRAGWLAAIATAYQRLELELLDRAFNGTEKVLTRKDGSEERMREYSNQLGLSLLKLHRDTAIEADSEMPPDDVEEIQERLISKLRRLKERNEREAKADQERNDQGGDAATARSD